MRITLLLEPSADRAIPFAVGPERYQRLADELGRYAATPVKILNDVLRKAPADGYVLFAGSGDLSRSLAECASKFAERLTPRLVLVDVSWQKALEQLEEHRLAGAVDSLRMSEWLARPSSATGPFGLRYLAKPLGASCVPMPALLSARYCLLQSEQHRGMPHLLANYLAAYDRDQQPLSAVTSVALARVARTAHEERTVRAAQVESVTIKRAIDSLRGARESAGLTLSQLAQRSGIVPDEIELLEGSNFRIATLGTLRAYVRAMQPNWGWTLSDLDITPRHLEQGAELNDEPSPPTAEVPWVLTERGMTRLGNQRVRRRRVYDEFYEPGNQMQKEELNAGV